MIIIEKNSDNAIKCTKNESSKKKSWDKEFILQIGFPIGSEPELWLL